jgi:hypothetical protein
LAVLGRTTPNRVGLLPFSDKTELLSGEEVFS